MILRVKTTEYIRGFIIKIRFGDGIGSEIDLEGDLEGEVFEPLKQISYFKKFYVHPELRTITWPNGADFAPEYLYEKAKQAA
jgi:hypothetical protein